MPYNETMAAAVRYNPLLRVFHDRLKQRGKKAQVILTAVARKLVGLANAILRHGKPWNPNPCPNT